MSSWTRSEPPGTLLAATVIAGAIYIGTVRLMWPGLIADTSAVLALSKQRRRQAPRRGASVHVDAAPRSHGHRSRRRLTMAPSARSLRPCAGGSPRSPGPSRVRRFGGGARDRPLDRRTVGHAWRGLTRSLAMLTSLSTEDLIPVDHPIRKIRVVVDYVLPEVDGTFDAMYAAGGRRSVPPETRLKSSMSMAMCSIRAERSLCERRNDHVMFTCWPCRSISGPSTRRRPPRTASACSSTKSRTSSSRRWSTRRSCAAALSEHLSVDGTLLSAGVAQALHNRIAGRRPSREAPRRRGAERHPVSPTNASHPRAAFRRGGRRS